MMGKLIDWIDEHPVRAAVYVLLIVSGVFWLAIMIRFPERFPDWVGIRQLPKTDGVQPAKTLWDWLDLFIVSLVVALALFWLNTSQKNREDKREAEREAQEEKRQIDNQQQTTLLDYYDKMSELILEKRLGRIAARWEEIKAPEKAPVVVVARTLTLSTFRNLDSSRNASVLRFLGDAGLADKILSGTDTQNVDFSYSDLTLANLKGAYLFGAKLNGANLIEADLSGADLSLANLREADLSGADLIEADLSGADLIEATYDNETIWPYADFNPKERGARKVNW
jgi:uncharacterized protein YjbI with pentapeptide repeats